MIVPDPLDDLADPHGLPLSGARGDDRRDLGARHGPARPVRSLDVLHRPAMIAHVTQRPLSDLIGLSSRGHER